MKQCAEGYYIEAQDEGPDIAMAYPVQRVCTWRKAGDVDFIDAEECPDVRLVCAKPFGVFPNACSGTAHLAKQWFVSFYSFSKENSLQELYESLHVITQMMGGSLQCGFETHKNSFAELGGICGAEGCLIRGS